MRGSLRIKLLAWVIAITTLTLTVFCGGIYLHLRYEGLRDVDRGLKVFRKSIISSFSDESLSLQEIKNLENLASRSPVRMWVQISLPDKSVVHESAGYPLTALPGWEPDSARTVTVGRESFRVLDHVSNKYRIRTVGNLAMVIETEKDLLTAYALAMPLSLAVIGLGCWLILQTPLSSVSKIADMAARITVGNLSARLPIPNSADELRRLTEVMNTMFARLEGSFDQARRFTADASHQLKTPLTVIRGELERLLRSQNGNTEEIVRVLERVSYLSLMVERLLFLSRMDADQIHPHFLPFDMSPLLHDLNNDFSCIAESQGLEWTSDISSQLMVSGDAPLLGQLIVNLLENAIKYNRPSGFISLSARSVDDEIQVTVKNSGQPIPPKHQAKIFERFHRGNTMSASNDGQGLGLNIAWEIARIHGGMVALTSSNESCTIFSLHLPLLQK